MAKVEYLNFKSFDDEDRRIGGNYLVKTIDNQIADALYLCSSYGLVDTFIRDSKRRMKEPINNRFVSACYDYDLDYYKFDYVRSKLSDEAQALDNLLENREKAQQIIGINITQFSEKIGCAPRDINEQTWNSAKICEYKLVRYYQSCLNGADTFEKRMHSREEHKDMIADKEHKLNVASECIPYWKTKQYYKPNSVVQVVQSKEICEQEFSKQEIHDMWAKKRAEAYQRIIPEIIPYRMLVQKIAQMKKQH